MLRLITINTITSNTMVTTSNTVINKTIMGASSSCMSSCVSVFEVTGRVEVVDPVLPVGGKTVTVTIGLRLELNMLISLFRNSLNCSSNTPQL